jgi:cytochrome c oxidase subunit II
MVIAIALILITAASLLFYFLSPWHLSPLASNWGAIDNTILMSFLVTGFVFVILVSFMAAAVIHYRYDEKRRAGYEPENKKLEIWLTVVSTVGIAALLVPGLFVWSDFVGVPDDAHRVEVVGSQWHWMFRYPGEDGEFGRVHTRFMDEDNPLGIDPDDPAGQDDVIVDYPVLYLPVDQAVEMRLRSRDVIHNFKVPNFRAKMDALPGQISHFWLTPTESGEFQAVCAQHCGIAHFAMRARVKVVEEDEFEAWLAEQSTFADHQAITEGNPDNGQALYQSCAACHGDAGQGDPGQNSPRLAGMNSRYFARQIENFRKGARGDDPDDTFGAQMAPFANMLDAEGIRDVAAYLNTLPAEAAEATISGNENRGQRLYRTCSACHGRAGEGRPGVNAPRLAGMDDWYLVTQLNNFKNGVRGRHPDDMYGSQMIDMVQFLGSEQDIRDVVAYINSLPGPQQTAQDSSEADAEE